MSNVIPNNQVCRFLDGTDDKMVTEDDEKIRWTLADGGKQKTRNEGDRLFATEICIQNNESLAQT